MRRARREGASLNAFFRGLRASVLEAWTSREGYAYDRVIYAVGYPYRSGDTERILAWARRPQEAAFLPPLARLNRHLTSTSYPHLAEGGPREMSGAAWSAVLHFQDPSYPLATPRAHAALAALGFELPAKPSLPAYPAFAAAVDELKERTPVWAVPETNWYLARVLQVGLEAFAETPMARGRSPAAAAA